MYIYNVKMASEYELTQKEKEQIQRFFEDTFMESVIITKEKIKCPKQSVN